MPLPIRRAFLVQYEVGQLHHKRVPLCHVDADDYVIATPQLDVYIETLAVLPLICLTPLGQDRVLPPHIRERDAHRFRLRGRGRMRGFLTDEELDRMTVDAQDLARAERVTRGLPGDAAGPATFDASWKFTLAMALGSFPVGTMINPGERPGDVKIIGDKALCLMADDTVAVCNVIKPGGSDLHNPLMGGSIQAPKDALVQNKTIEAETKPSPPFGLDLDDLRTLVVKYDANGRRFRDFQDALALTSSVPLDAFDTEGPRTFLDYVRLAHKKAHSLTAGHTKSIVENGVNKKSMECLMHEMVNDFIEAGMCIDQLNCGNLVCMELAARWAQLLEHAVAQNPGKPSLNDKGAFLGQVNKKHNLVPALSKHVADRARDEALILKEQRKAREERHLTQNPKKNPPGGE